jgi:long-chain acyl-CoA synthetase
MISPLRVEGALTLAPEIAQAMVFGDRRPFLVAVVVPDPEFAAGFAKEHGAAGDLPSLSGNPRFHQALGDVIARVNGELAPTERVRRFIIAREPFSIDNAQMTPTLKIRRHAIRAAYEAAFDGLYEGKGIAA